MTGPARTRPTAHRCARLVAVAGLAAVVAGTAPASAGPAPFSATERVSVGPGDVQGNRASSGLTAPSADCRFVAFTSRAPNWVVGDTAGHLDVFVRDRATSTTEVISVTPDGRLGNERSWLTDLSPDGRFVLFGSLATDLVAGLEAPGVFLRDRTTGVTELVSVSSSEEPADGTSGSAALSANGRFVVFLSQATNLAPDADPPGAGNEYDLFLRDRQRGVTRLLSRGIGGRPSSVTTDAPQISDDGRYVLFGSRDARLVRNDPNKVGDVFVRDLRRSTVRLVSVDPRRNRAAGGKRGMLAADGRVAAFMAHRRLVKRDRDTAWDVYSRDLRAGRTLLASPPVPGAGTTRTGSVRTASISGDGRYVVVNSQSTDLALGDADTRYDTFVRDTVARTTTLVSVGPDGRSGPGNAYGGDISRDGSCVAFTAAAASNLVPEDTNQAQDVYVRVRGLG